MTELSQNKDSQPKKRPSLGALYEYSYDKKTIKLRNRKCPRCGNIMAYHKTPKQRLTCGSCSYTDYVKTQS